MTSFWCLHFELWTYFTLLVVNLFLISGETIRNHFHKICFCKPRFLGKNIFLKNFTQLTKRPWERPSEKLQENLLGLYEKEVFSISFDVSNYWKSWFRVSCEPAVFIEKRTLSLALPWKYMEIFQVSYLLNTFEQ